MLHNNDMTRRVAAIHYLVGVGLLTLYGTQVCPFIETLPAWVWASVLAAVYGAFFVVRLALESSLVLSAPVVLRARRQFWFDFVVFAAGGASASLINAVAFDFPVESGLKVLLGSSCIGFFAGLDLALCREQEAVKGGDYSHGPFVSSLPFSSLTRKFSLASSAAVLFAALIVCLVVIKDIRLLEASDKTMDFSHLLIGIALEIVFTGAVLLGFTLRVIWSYSHTLKLLFDMQTHVLSAVGKDQLEQKVPVVTDDEFGAVAEHTNKMIEGLREKRRIRSTLGKVVDDRIVEKMLDTDGELALGGNRRELAILVSDVRGFTSRTESAQPEQLVADLNGYFTRMVEIVQRHNGVVDKFIGDGMLAVFGIDSDDCACEDAVHAAMEMQSAMDEVNALLSAPMRIGVGVHQGSVISGLIGSPERLEFTVIGDAVNTAARLESLTKELGVGVAISRAVHESISAELRAPWQDMGEHKLKGKAKPVPVFGLKE